MSYVEPILVDTKTACTMLGIKKTTCFQMLRDNKLERRRIYGKTLVTAKSIYEAASGERGAV